MCCFDITPFKIKNEWIKLMIHPSKIYKILDQGILTIEQAECWLE